MYMYVHGVYSTLAYEQVGSKENNPHKQNMCTCTHVYTVYTVWIFSLTGDTTVQGVDCVVCLNKNYTNKRTKFKITASLQRDTQQVYFI